MIALRGIPAFYIHSLLATPNDHSGVEKSGRARMINRHSWDEPELTALLSQPMSNQAIIFNELRRRIKIRTEQPAFHPDGRQEIVFLGENLFAFWRYSLDGRQKIFVVHNLTDQLRTVYFDGPLDGLIAGEWVGLLTGEIISSGQGQVKLPPYHVLWLAQVD
jgi:sucrose phosphorylase